jgi:CheY-like chemotaxis protein
MLLDYNLPRGHGGDILAAAAGNPLLAGVPKAILSSSLRPAEMQEARRLGAVRFITKPANLADFFREVGTAVKELVRQQRAAPSAN